ANAGRSFLIFLVGPGGTSRNLTSLPAGAPAGCPLGNEQGIQVTFTCNPITPPVCPPGTPGCPPGIDVAVLRACDLNRSASGVFTLTVTGDNIKDQATVTIDGVEPRKVKFKNQTGTDPSGRRIFSRIVLKGGICAVLPGSIIVTNPGARESLPLLCNDACPTN
ncbi:MAG TPA: hypothetical protein VF131_09420, partial [Blastocatellia bacterium]|nr:hypothetical protein [Blastocatellia bacterium]